MKVAIRRVTHVGAEMGCVVPGGVLPSP